MEMDKVRLVMAVQLVAAMNFSTVQMRLTERRRSGREIEIHNTMSLAQALLRTILLFLSCHQQKYVVRASCRCVVLQQFVHGWVNQGGSSQWDIGRIADP